MAYLYYDPNEPKIYSPEEISSMKANNERLQNEATMGNAGMNLGLNVAQLPAATGFGFLLGNILGRGLNNYLENKWFKKTTDSNNNSAPTTSATPRADLWRQRNNIINQIQNNNRAAWGMPANGEYFPPYNFSNYNKTPAELFRQQNQPSNNQYWKPPANGEFFSNPNPENRQPQNNQWWNPNWNLQPSFLNYNNATPASVFQQNQANPQQNFFPKQYDFSNNNATLANAAQKGLLRW